MELLYSNISGESFGARVCEKGRNGCAGLAQQEDALRAVRFSPASPWPRHPAGTPISCQDGSFGNVGASLGPSFMLRMCTAVKHSVQSQGVSVCRTWHQISQEVK